MRSRSPFAYLLDHVRFLGRRTVILLAVATLAGLSLGFLEALFAGFLQLLLRSMGLLSGAEISGVFAWVPEDLGVLALLLLALGVARGAVVFVSNTASHIAKENAQGRQRLLCMAHLLRSDARKSPLYSEIQAQFDEVAPKSSHFCYNVSYVVSYVTQIASLAAILLWLAWLEGLISLAALVAVGAVSRYLSTLILQASAKMPETAKAYYRILQNVARNLLLVRVLRMQRAEFLRGSRGLLNYTRLSQSAHFLQNLNTFFVSVFGVALIIGLILLREQTGTSAAEFLSFLYLLVRLAQTLSQAAGIAGQVLISYPQYQAAFDYFWVVPEEARREAVRASASLPFWRPFDLPQPVFFPGGQRLPTLAAPAVELSGASFRYAPDAPDVVAAMSLRVAAGQRFVIVGPSGSGKSTLLHLMLGLYEPTAGTVRVGGLAPAQYFADSTHLAGYVGPDPFLLADTLRANLTYGCAVEVTDEDLWTALRFARLETFVRSLPAGLNHTLGDGGEGLSAGQKQRLSLARAVLPRPSLLILDEATANIDEKTETEISEALDSLRGRTTVIIVTHRPGMLRQADLVLRMRAGGEYQLETPAGPA